MKKWFIVIALAMVLFVALVQAQTPTKEPSLQEKYLTSEMGRLNSMFQLFQRDMNTFINSYPDFKDHLEKCRDDIFKELQTKFQDIQKQLEAEKAKKK